MSITSKVIELLKNPTDWQVTLGDYFCATHKSGIRLWFGTSGFWRISSPQEYYFNFFQRLRLKKYVKALKNGVKLQHASKLDNLLLKAIKGEKV
jgi:hypothetical protein